MCQVKLFDFDSGELLHDFYIDTVDFRSAVEFTIGNNAAYTSPPELYFGVDTIGFPFNSVVRIEISHIDRFNTVIPRGASRNLWEQFTKRDLRFCELRCDVPKAKYTAYNTFELMKTDGSDDYMCLHIEEDIEKAIRSRVLECLSYRNESE